MAPVWLTVLAWLYLSVCLCCAGIIAYDIGGADLVIGCRRWPILAERRWPAVEGWCPVEELLPWAFAHTRVVMANEAHSGLTRCIRTREIGVRMVRAAHEAGVRRLAMEALPCPAGGVLEPVQAIPPGAGGYLGQPEMRRLITTAIDLGWSLWAYDAVIAAGQDPAELLSIEFTNWREREQASNLCRILSAVPQDPLLVWSGNSHASKRAQSEWVPMGFHFAAMSGVEPFVIDQTVTVDFPGARREWVPDLLAAVGDTLDAHGGTSAILRGQAPAPLDRRLGIDAVVVSTENALT